MSINILTDDIINQIAAGEVIENQSAVVKELVENSIDSGADLIEVFIKNFGLDEILVRDNGMGMDFEDLRKAPLKHTTSKIKNFEDLYSISTMGFRGEALSSIFSVSLAKIISKKDKVGYQICSENLEDIQKVHTNKGTSVFVQNLFYNTPARKKYLKSNNIELKNIVDIFMKFCIFYFDRKFVLKHNNKILINKPIFANLKDNLCYVLGEDLKKDLLDFEFETLGIKISGFLAKPSNLTYSYKKNQYLFVNGRYVKSKLINDAIYDGIGSNLMHNRHPFFVFFLEIDPEIIDVNVHPSKIEIRFENEKEIFNFIKNSVNDIFLKNETSKPFEIDFDFSKELNLEQIGFKINRNNLNKKENKNYNKNYFLEDNQKELEVCENKVVYQKSNKDDFNLNLNSNQYCDILEDKKQEIKEEKEENFGPLFNILSNFKIIGQIHKTYFIIETQNEIFLIDQHAAEEKVFYENFLKEFENKKVKIQNLLKPKIFNLNPKQLILFEENKDFLEKVGFFAEFFGNSQVILRAVPCDFYEKDLNYNIFLEVLDEFDYFNSKILEEQKIEKIALKSCKSAIKAGDELNNLEIKNLVEKMRRLKEPFNCPHGRPVILRWSFYDLEKKFKRIV